MQASRRVKSAAVVAVLAITVAAPAGAQEVNSRRVKAYGAKPVSWVDDGCRIFVHHRTKPDHPRPRPQPELHVQCTLETGSLGEGAVIKYRFPKRGAPLRFGALIEEDGHGRLGDLPYISAWQDPNRPRIGYVHVPGPHLDRPNGTYVHVMYVVWNGALDDEVREVDLPPHGRTGS